MATALAQSINTIAVRLASEVGSAQKDRRDRPPVRHQGHSRRSPEPASVALGAYEVNLLELTSAFQVFQQGGQRSAPYLVEQITTDARGDVIYSDHAPSPRRQRL